MVLHCFQGQCSIELVGLSQLLLRLDSVTDL